MTEELRVEAEGETVGEAKWSALRELERLDPQVDKASVRFDVVAEGQRGLLGVGYSPARVVATAVGSAVHAPASVAPIPPPDPASGPAALAGELVERIAAGVGLAVDVDVSEEADTILVSCSGGDLGVLIGRHGQTIDAIQYLVNAILARTSEGPRKDAVVDAAGYRERRTATLEELAARSAERARASGAEVSLDPMTAVERKVVHLRLRDEPDIETSSAGSEPNRYVVIRPAPGAPAAA